MEPQLRALVAAILERTYRDLASGPKGNGHDVSGRDYRDARAFIETGWFSSLCAYLDLEPDDVRRTLLSKAAS